MISAHSRRRGIPIVATGVLLIAASIGGCAQTRKIAVPETRSPGPRLVIVLRHAEKASDAGNDPPLTAAGEARAQALARTLADADVRAIMISGARRTNDTARPLAERFGIAPRVVPVSAGDIESRVRATVEAVRAVRDGTVVVVGHSNTVPAILSALGIGQPPTICDSSHANLFLVVGDSVKAGFVRAWFGEPDPPHGPECD